MGVGEVKKNGSYAPFHKLLEHSLKSICLWQQELGLWPRMSIWAPVLPSICKSSDDSWNCLLMKLPITRCRTMIPSQIVVISWGALRSFEGWREVWLNRSASYCCPGLIDSSTSTVQPHCKQVCTMAYTYSFFYFCLVIPTLYFCFGVSLQFAKLLLDMVDH